MVPDLRSELAALHAQAYGWALRCCRDREDAEEALQQSYLKVLDGRARFDGRSSFRTWLFGVIRLTAREQARRRRLGLSRLERWWRGAARPSPADARADEGADRAVVLEAVLRRLSRRQQEVLHLVFYQELTIQEAASVLEMPVGTARTHYERGKARLRALLDSQGARDE